MWALAPHGGYAGTWLASFKSEHLHQLGNAPPQSAGSRPRRPKAHLWRKGSKPSAVESRDGGRQAVSAKWQQPPSAAGGSSAMCASSGSTLRQLATIRHWKSSVEGKQEGDDQRHARASHAGPAGPASGRLAGGRRRVPPLMLLLMLLLIPLLLIPLLLIPLLLMLLLMLLLLLLLLLF